MNSSQEPFVAKAVPYPSAVPVAGAKTVSKLTVTVKGLEHNELYNVDILLVGPTGVKVILMSRTSKEYHETVSGLTYTFDDAAMKRLPATGSPLPSGTYRPTSYRDHAVDPKFVPPAPKAPYQQQLSAFNGTDPNGVWKLFVVDTLDGRGGRIAGGWILTINGSGGPPPSSPMCNGRKATIVGAGKINGTLHPDVIVGSEGNDTITAVDSDDVICALAGDDKVFGGRNDDWIDAGPGKDKVWGDEHADTVFGGDNADFLSGAFGDDRLSGDGGNDSLSGSLGDDSLFGGSGKDTLKGAGGNDKVSGGIHGDTLYGGNGVDKLSGDAGLDRCEAARVPQDVVLDCEELFSS